MPIVTLKFKDSVISKHPLERGRSLTIGRRKGNDIVIENLAVSGHHAKIDTVGGGFVLVDLQSKNGSFVNEQLVTSHRLKPGDVISIGKHHLLYAAGDEADGSDAAAPKIDQTMVMDTSTYRSMVRKSGPQVPQPLLRRPDEVGALTFLAGGQGKIVLNGDLIRIGKDPASEIVVKSLWVGWAAATVSRRPDGYYLSRVGGISKPRVNGFKVRTSQRLQDLDVIDIGPVKLQFFTKDEPKPAPV
jgi:pSer/pThr/pTyr-binding forkhead associated (FHA) protein